MATFAEVIERLLCDLDSFSISVLFIYMPDMAEGASK